LEKDFIVLYLGYIRTQVDYRREKQDNDSCQVDGCNRQLAAHLSSVLRLPVKRRVANVEETGEISSS